jgi:hypothetical protein
LLHRVVAVTQQAADLSEEAKRINRREAILRRKNDSAYGSAPMLNWLVEEKRITPHIPVIDKSKREDGTFSREDFRNDNVADVCTCPRRKRSLRAVASRS